MSIGERLPSPEEVVGRQMLFFGRSDVQNQFFSIAFCLIVAWLISRRFWTYLTAKFPEVTEFYWNDQRLSLKQYFAALLNHLDFPIMSLGLLNLSQIIFASQNWKEGLLFVAIRLLWVYLIYQFFLVSLYAIFPLNIIQKFHYRLFAPLLSIFIIGTIINLYNNVSQIAQIPLFNLFNTAISLRIIFSLVGGLYFWIVIVGLIENLSLDFIRLQPNLDAGSAEASLLLIRYFLITLGIVLILGYIGVNATAIAAITGGLSVGIGFGLQQVVSNFVSGILLLFEGVLKPGDIISIEGQISEVKSLGIRATTVKVLTDNSEKIIPNQTFFTSDITTYTGSDRLVNCSITIGVGYDSCSQQVMDILLKIAQEHPQVLQDPSPSAFFIEFGESTLNFELKFWLDDVNLRTRVISDINCQILNRFSQLNIEIPFPQRDIHIYSQSNRSLTSDS